MFVTKFVIITIVIFHKQDTVLLVVITKVIRPVWERVVCVCVCVCVCVFVCVCVCAICTEKANKRRRHSNRRVRSFCLTFSVSVDSFHLSADWSKASFPPAERERVLKLCDELSDPWRRAAPACHTMRPWITALQQSQHRKHRVAWTLGRGQVENRHAVWLSPSELCYRAATFDHILSLSKDLKYCIKVFVLSLRFQQVVQAL